MPDLFLKIENPGVAPAESFTILGLSITRNNGSNQTLGRFGSGGKMACGVLLRQHIQPTIYCGNLKLDFFTKQIKVKDEISEVESERVCVKFSGKLEDGTTRNNTEELGFVTGYGEQDWNHTDMALREFVSNALDRCIRATGDWDKTIIEIVPENQVRAKAGSTRIFIPINEDVLNFYKNLGRWFLHFSDDKDKLDQKILIKSDRNLINQDGSQKQGAVIYRRGVRVREDTDHPSMFDYNLEDIQLDESRNSDPYAVKTACARALMDTRDTKILAKWFESLHGDTKYFETTFDSYYLTPSYYESQKVVDEKKDAWTRAFKEYAGDRGAMSMEHALTQVKNAGYDAVRVPASILDAADKYGIKTHRKILTEEEQEGRIVSEPTCDATSAVQFALNLFKPTIPNPQVKCYYKADGSGPDAYHRDGTIFVNKSICAEGSIHAGDLALTDKLLIAACGAVVSAMSYEPDKQREILLTHLVELQKIKEGL